MTHSEQINEIAAAMAKAQGVMTGAKKDSDNPFFRSRYADLASVWEACRKALTDNGIAVLQSPRIKTLGEAEIATRISKQGEERDVVRALTEVTVTTLLTHSSGQWVRDDISCILPTSDPQAIGSGATYLRRYSLAAFAGVAPEDDDGEEAMGRGATSTAKRPADGAIETVTVKVLGIVQRPISNGTKYLISASDRQTYSTLKKAIADTAKSAQEAGLEIELTWKQTQYGRDVVSIKELVEAPL